MMDNYHYLHSNLDTIIDPDLNALFDEIYELRHEAREGQVIQFLYQSFHPFLSEKRKPFDKKEFSIQYFLKKKIKDLIDTEIYKLCIELVGVSHLGHVENFHDTTMYVFLNRAIKDTPKQKKLKTAPHRTW